MVIIACGKSQMVMKRKGGKADRCSAEEYYAGEHVIECSGLFVGVFGSM